MEEKQRQELKKIMLNQYQQGPFTGMIFNHVMEKADQASSKKEIEGVVEEVAIKALTTKLKLLEMIEDDEVKF